MSSSVSIGNKYGMLTVISLQGRDSQRNRLWLCECDCGNTKIVNSHRLTRVQGISCGCKNKAEDKSGKRYGSLIVLKRKENTYGKNGKATAVWICQCDCGNIVEAGSSDLNSGKTKSCGCMRIANNKSRAMVHNEIDQKLYYVYQEMKARCNRKTNCSYRFYGARGIKVCDEWNVKKGFPLFREWALSSGYKEGLTLDRIDNSGDYSPDNCRWITPLEQAHNTRRNVFAEYKGETKILSDWSRELGIDVRWLCMKYKEGKTIEEIVFLDTQKRRLHESTNNKICQTNKA